MEPNNPLTHMVIATKTANLLARILGNGIIHLAAENGETPPVQLDPYLAYQPEIRDLAALCKAYNRRTGREATVNALIEQFNMVCGTFLSNSKEKTLEAAILRFYQMLHMKYTGMPANEVVLAGWPLINHFLNEYINETQNGVTLNFE